MNRKLLIVIVLTLFLSSLKAQERTRPFNFSIRFGPNVGWFKSNSDLVRSSGAFPGFSWGALCEVPVQDQFSFVSGFNIHFANGKIEYPGNNPGYSLIREKYNIKYLELPAMLKVYTREVNGVRYYGQIGLGTAFRMNSRVERTFQLPPQSSAYAAPENLNSDNLTSFIRESLILGIGGQYAFQENLRLFGGLNFNNGFTDMLKKGPYMSSDPKVIANFVELNIGLYF